MVLPVPLPYGEGAAGGKIVISRSRILHGLLIVAAFAAATRAQTLATNAKPPAGQFPENSIPLQITLDLEGQPASGTLDYLTPFRIVFLNTGKEPLRIANPLAPEYRGALKLQFKPKGGGEPITIERRVLGERDRSQADLLDRLDRFDGRPISKIITLTPGFSHYVEIDFSQIRVTGEEGKRQLEWLGLPPPCAPGEFTLSATYEAPAAKDDAGNPTWTGSLTTPEQTVRLFAHRLLSPHRLLQHQFPEAALELLKENPKKWITRREHEEWQWMPLHLAVMNEHLEVVKWLVEHGAPVHATDAQQHTALHLARSPEVLKVLLTECDSLDNRDGKELLQFVAKRAANLERESDDHKCRRRSHEVVKLLREAGAPNSMETAIYLNESDSALKTLIAEAQKNDPDELASAFRLASQYGRSEICQTLLELPEIDLFDTGDEGEDPLILEALKQPALLKRFIAQSERAKREFESHSGEWTFYGNANLLHYAAQRGTPETITLLIDHGFDIFAPTGREGFDAELAAEFAADFVGDLEEAIEEVFEVGIDEENEGPPPQTPLEIAARAGRGENILAIIEHPKFKAAPRLVRWDALNQALIAFAGAVSESAGEGAGEKEEDLRKWFTAFESAGADIRRLGFAAVQRAAEQMDAENPVKNRGIRQTIAILRELGAGIDLPSAVAIGDEKLVAELLPTSSDSINSLSSDGVPLLHRAVAMNHLKITTLLIESGCDLEIRLQSEDYSYSGETALAVAARHELFDIAKLLIESGARVNACDATGRPPLFMSFRSNDLKLAELLLQNGARTDLADEDGSTLEDWADGNKELEALLKKYTPDAELTPR